MNGLDKPWKIFYLFQCEVCFLKNKSYALIVKQTRREKSFTEFYLAVSEFHLLQGKIPCGLFWYILCEVPYLQLPWDFMITREKECENSCFGLFLFVYLEGNHMANAVVSQQTVPIVYRFTKLEGRIGSVVERVKVCSQLARILKSKRIIRSVTFRALIVVLGIKLKDQKVIVSLDHLELFRPAVNVQQIQDCC